MSSASFFVARTNVTDEQLATLLERLKTLSDGWSVEERDGLVCGSTIMDNGEMGDLLAEIGITGVQWYED